jgi:hypothetical protein
VSEVALASFDALELTEQLTATSQGASEGELHTLAYLSCLLAVFDGHQPNWWGYRFTATRAGSPFAVAMRQATLDGTRAGFIHLEDRVLTLSERGGQELQSIRPLVLNRRRERYLEAAAATALTMPLPAVSDALSYEPGLHGALRFMRTKELLDETGLLQLEAQFADLAEAVKGSDDGDLLVPSIVWLTFLARRGPTEQEAA